MLRDVIDAILDLIYMVFSPASSLWSAIGHGILTAFAEFFIPGGYGLFFYTARELEQVLNRYRRTGNFKVTRDDALDVVFPVAGTIVGGLARAIIGA